MELEYILVLETRAERIGGSNPFVGTNFSDACYMKPE